MPQVSTGLKSPGVLTVRKGFSEGKSVEMARPQQPYDDQQYGQTDSYYQDDYGNPQEGHYDQQGPDQQGHHDQQGQPQGDGYYDEQYAMFVQSAGIVLTVMQRIL